MNHVTNKHNKRTLAPFNPGGPIDPLLPGGPGIPIGPISPGSPYNYIITTCIHKALTHFSPI